MALLLPFILRKVSIWAWKIHKSTNTSISININTKTCHLDNWLIYVYVSIGYNTGKQCKKKHGRPLAILQYYLIFHLVLSVFLKFDRIVWALFKWRGRESNLHKFTACYYSIITKTGTSSHFSIFPVTRNTWFLDNRVGEISLSVGMDMKKFKIPNCSCAWWNAGMNNSLF